MSSDRPMPRKLPQQERARVLFDAILDASAELLESVGPSFTLQAVAQRAGVSPGSLYQYFADRDALVAALIDRQIEHDRRLLQDFRVSPARKHTELAELLVEGVLRLYAPRPRLMAHMVLLMHQLGRSDDLKAISQAFQLEIVELLVQRSPERTRSACETAAEVALFSLLGTVRQLALSRAEDLRSAELRERLVAMARQALA